MKDANKITQKKDENEEKEPLKEHLCGVCYQKYAKH